MKNYDRDEVKRIEEDIAHTSGNRFEVWNVDVPVAPAPTASATHEKVLSIDAAQELVDEIKNLRAEVTRLTEWNNNQLETITIQRKIRAYVAFVLTGDELADVQMAADKTMEKLQALEAYASSQSEKLAGVGQQAAEEIAEITGADSERSKQQFAAIIDRVIAGRVKP